MHVPGHSARGSGALVVGANVVVVTGRRVGGGLGLFVVTARELSQHTDPCLQLAVREISTEGRSQKAAIIFSRQNPGQRGAGGGVGGCVGRRVVDTTFLLSLLASAPLVMQQLPSSGQYASLSMPSQNRAIKSPTHSPRHFFFCSGSGCACLDGPADGAGYLVVVGAVFSRLDSVVVLVTVVRWVV